MYCVVSEPYLGFQLMRRTKSVAGDGLPMFVKNNFVWIFIPKEECELSWIQRTLRTFATNEEGMTSINPSLKRKNISLQRKGFDIEDQMKNQAKNHASSKRTLVSVTGETMSRELLHLGYNLAHTR